MLRSTRRIARLIGSLLIGASVPTSVGLAAIVTIGCKDESQPEYWVEKLEEPAWQARAIKRLEQFFEDALSRANKDIKVPEVQDLINKTIEPATKTYVEGGDMLDSKSRVALIKLLAGYKDKRAEPAFKKAFLDFAKAPKGGKDDQDIKWAAIAAGDLKSESLAGPMVEAFAKLRANTMLGGVVYKDYNAAMLEVASKSWVQPLLAKIEAPVTRPQNRKDKGGVEDYMDQQFWQTTAAAVLGKIGDPAAVEPLIKVVLDPEKVDFHQTAVVALIQLGKPASDAAVGLLKGTNANLHGYCVQRIKDTTGADPKGKPCSQQAAVIVGAIGRPEAVGPMIEVLKAETDEPTKVLVARELSRLPASADSVAAFKEAYESLRDADIPAGVPGLDSLTEAASQFFDAGLVPWLIERAQTAKGEAEERKALQLGIVLTVIKLYKPDQLGAVKRAVDSYGTDLEKGVFKQTEALVKACGDRAICYVEALQKPENQDRKNQFVGIKAGYMTAIFGNDQTRDEIVSRLDSIDNAALRFVAAQAIDRLSPKGATTAVEKIGAIIDKNAKSPDRDKAMGDAPLKQVMYRLQARGG
jgi:hypothetical protein